MTTTRKYTEDWDAISRAIKAKAGWTCEVCGMRFDERGNALEGQPRWQCQDGRAKKLTTHHINDDTTDNSPENLLPCCQDCHLSVEHWKPGDSIPTRWAYEFWAWIRERGLSYQIQKELFEHV